MPLLPRIPLQRFFSVKRFFSVQRLVAGRRNRLAQLVVVRRQANLQSRTCLIRATAVVSAAVLAATSAWFPYALLLMLPAFLASALEVRQTTTARSVPPWLLGLWGVSAALLLAVPVWVSVDVSPLWRTLSLAAAVVVVISVGTGVFVLPAWFDPDARTGPVLELLRRGCGPQTAAATAAIAFSRPWPPDLMPVIAVLSLLPLLTGVRVWNTDLTLRYAVPLIREEGQRGRDLVLREIHGALSTELRQLEQHARERRWISPEVYELAVSANSGLRETLTLAEEDRDTSTTADSLTAPVLTLTRAEGAAATTRIEVGELDERDRQVARYVLNELVRNALSAGATQLEIAFTEEGISAGSPPGQGPGRRLVISVTDNAASLPDQAWLGPGSGTAQLEDMLAAFAGLMTWESAAAGTKTVHARWRGRH